MTFSFLWKGKDKTRRLSAINTLEEGGMKMIDIQNVINNGNRTDWSPIRSVIIRGINKIGRPQRRESDLLITSMIAD